MRYVSKIFLVLCLSLGIGAVAADAQIESEGTVEANIPHSFVVEKTTLPAGKYTIRAADPDANPNLMEIRSANGHTFVYFEAQNAMPKETPAKTELVFDKLGDTYFLSEIFVAGDNTGARLPKSPMEGRLEGKGVTVEKRSVAALIRPFRKVAKKL